MPNSLSHSERMLVLAPIGRDTAIAIAILSEAGIAAEAAANPGQLLNEFDRGVGAAIITEEAAGTADLNDFSAWLARQPAWSDLPIIVLTHHGGGPERNPGAARLAGILGNVTFLERPFHPTTLVSIANTALRGRRRQYEARARIEEVREAEARLRVALKAGRLGSWIYDIASGELTSSERCKAIFGRGPGQSLTYEELRQAIHPDDRQTMQDAVARTMATAGDYAIEYRVVWPDGSLHWVEARARLTKAADGQPSQMIGVSLDITERKRLEETLAARVAERTAELEASERRFRAVFDSAFQMAMLVDLDGRVVLANRTALDAIDQTLAAVVGTTLWETPWWSSTLHEARRVRQEFPRAVAGDLIRHEAELAFPDGSQRVLDFSLKPVLTEDSAVVQVIAEGRDITELKQTEATLRQSQKLETLGQLTGNVAHDFNNLLMAVIANLDLLRRRVGDDLDLLRLVEGASQGAQRGAALTQRLLAFSRRQDLQPQAVHLPALIGGMHHLLQQSLGPRIQVEVKGADDLRPVLVDPNQLELAILNLALNSRDAMPDGGWVTITFDETEIGSGQDQVLEPGAYLRLRLEDTGCGMDEATLRRAIEPFFSTKGTGKGTGLGLSMIHGLAVQSGGGLRLSSRIGEGTVAELFLPVTAAAPQPTTGLRESSEAGSVAPATVLLVDDDALIAIATATMLEDLGHRVIEANSAEHALEILRSPAAVDVLLTDHAMPGMTGVELARHVRELRPGLPILLATGYADLPDPAGVDLPRLAKPYGQDQLEAVLGRLLRRAG
jgi:PAS domain S-box-containing protein